MTAPRGLGLWIAFPSNALAQHGGTWDELGACMRELGISWLAIRGGGSGARDAAHWSAPIARAAIASLHDAGIAVYVWWYSVPSAASREVALAGAFLEDGVDGLIVDAEAEWSGQGAAATAFGAALRAELGADVYLAHAPFAWLSLHQDWPYAEFAAFTDGVHPQCYWTELRHGSYAEMAASALTDWDRLVAVGDARARGYAPIGCTYGRESAYARTAPGLFVAADLELFLARYQGLDALSLYSLEAASPDCLAVLRARAGTQ